MQQGKYIGGKRHYKDIQERVDIVVQTVAERDLLMEYRRRWGMIIYVTDDDAYYSLTKNNDDLTDNNNWKEWEPHIRIHGVDSPEDHEAAEEADYGKLVGSNAETGAIEFREDKQHDQNTDTKLAQGTADEVTATEIRTHIDDADKHREINDTGAAVTDLWSADKIGTELAGKEDAFIKNTAFNKDFGTAAGTVTEGNDSRLSDDRTPTIHGDDKHSEDYAKVTDIHDRLHSMTSADDHETEAANAGKLFGGNDITGAVEAKETGELEEKELQEEELLLAHVVQSATPDTSLYNEGNTWLNPDTGRKYELWVDGEDRAWIQYSSIKITT